MGEETLTIIAQFGAAGLIGVMWMIERRASVHREQQLDEAHRELLARAHHVDALLGVVKDNTRAITVLEQSQQRLVAVLERTWNGAPAGSPVAPRTRA